MSGNLPPRTRNSVQKSRAFISLRRLRLTCTTTPRRGGGGFACSVGDSQTNVPVLINIDHVVTVWRWKTTAIPVQTCRICCPGDECTAEYIWAIGGYKYISLCYQCSKPDALLRGSLGHNAKRRQIFPPVPCGVQKEFGPPNLIV